MDAALNGKNVFITGGGGVGKSYVTKKIIERLEENGKKVIVTASTAKAAEILGGVTCHKALRIPIHTAWLARENIHDTSPKKMD